MPGAIRVVITKSPSVIHSATASFSNNWPKAAGLETGWTVIIVVSEKRTIPWRITAKYKNCASSFIWLKRGLRIYWFSGFNGN
jgi:hypothetical protein